MALQDSMDAVKSNIEALSNADKTQVDATNTFVSAQTSKNTADRADLLAIQTLNDSLDQLATDAVAAKVVRNPVTTVNK